ncbi:MAG: glycosyltransferase, partial [Phycisphaerae bacterium]|nr:glycosyltransferase [Phycisphaerae bacterium]
IVQADVKRYRLLERTHVGPMPGNLLSRVLRGCGLLAVRLASQPRVVLRALNVPRYRQLSVGLVLPFAMQPIREPRAYDVIHAHFAPNGLKAVFLRECGLLSGRLVTTFHGYDVLTYPRFYGKGVYRHLFRHGDVYTANTQYTRQRAIDLGCDPNLVHALPVGINLDQYGCVERSIRPHEPIRLLTVGRLVEFKGTEYGLRAVARLASEWPRLRYDVVGDGPLRQRLERLAADLHVRQTVRFHGGLAHDEVRRLYAQAHLYVQPGVVARNGSVEAQGRVLAEAQAVGLPVVASAVGGMPEVLSDGQSGFLVPPKDVDALTERLRFLMAHPERWPEIGRAGRRLVEQRFDNRRLTDRLLEIYDAAAKCDASQGPRGHQVP